jgi:hypothetical protein
MKKTVIPLLLLLALSTIPILLTKPVKAETIPSAKPNVVQWYTPSGQSDAGSLSSNPEFLYLYVEGDTTPIVTQTTIILQGTDAYGKNIEAEVLLNGSHDHPIQKQTYYLFNDTIDNKPVAFSSICHILQQNGSDGNKFSIYTGPNGGNPAPTPPWPQYLGEYHEGDGWKPGVCTPAWSTMFPSGQWPYPYLTTTGPLSGPGGVTSVPYQVEPINPDPLEVVVQWNDHANTDKTHWDLIPQADEISGANAPETLYIQGLDEQGNKLTATVNIYSGNKTVPVSTGSVTHTWSTICNVWGSGGSGNSFYIFTNPAPVRCLCYYTILIDHMSIHPSTYDILANPNDPCGFALIYVALRDQDGNLVHATTYTNPTDIDINFATTAGTVKPSSDVHIKTSSYYNWTTLWADTNPRTFRVSADAIVPELDLTSGKQVHPSLDLFVYTEMTEDGVSTVFSSGSSGGTMVDALMWGYTTTAFDPKTGCYDIPVAGPYGPTPAPAKPYLPYPIGPDADGIKLDGPIYEVTIPLYQGCNLISTPVSLILGDEGYSNYPKEFIEYADGSPPVKESTDLYTGGIPMDLLFGKTEAVNCIEAVWWYEDPAIFDTGLTLPPKTYMAWHVYIPGVSDDPGAFFHDGQGYWVKAEKACALELSGVWLENGPFTPPTYELKANSWNLIGVTSLCGISIADYLTGANSGTISTGTIPSTDTGVSVLSAVGPVWVYEARYAPYGWARNPTWGLWPGEAFWVYNKTPEDLYIAP